MANDTPRPRERAGEKALDNLTASMGPAVEAALNKNWRASDARWNQQMGKLSTMMDTVRQQMAAGMSARSVAKTTGVDRDIIRDSLAGRIYTPPQGSPAGGSAGKTTGGTSNEEQLLNSLLKTSQYQSDIISGKRPDATGRIQPKTSQDILNAQQQVLYVTRQRINAATGVTSDGKSARESAKLYAEVFKDSGPGLSDSERRTRRLTPPQGDNKAAAAASENRVRLSMQERIAQTTGTHRETDSAKATAKFFEEVLNDSPGAGSPAARRLRALNPAPPGGGRGGGGGGGRRGGGEDGGEGGDDKKKPGFNPLVVSRLGLLNQGLHTLATTPSNVQGMASLGGRIVGGLGGAALGAMGGSVIPGFGTVAGAITGGLIGAGIGGNAADAVTNIIKAPLNLHHELTGAMSVAHQGLTLRQSAAALGRAGGFDPTEFAKAIHPGIGQSGGPEWMKLYAADPQGFLDRLGQTGLTPGKGEEALRLGRSLYRHEASPEFTGQPQGTVEELVKTITSTGMTNGKLTEGNSVLSEKYMQRFADVAAIANARQMDKVAVLQSINEGVRISSRGAVADAGMIDVLTKITQSGMAGAGTGHAQLKTAEGITESWQHWTSDPRMWQMVGKALLDIKTPEQFEAAKRLTNPTYKIPEHGPERRQINEFLTADPLTRMKIAEEVFSPSEGNRFMRAQVEKRNLSPYNKNLIVSLLSGNIGIQAARTLREGDAFEEIDKEYRDSPIKDRDAAFAKKMGYTLNKARDVRIEQEDIRKKRLDKIFKENNISPDVQKYAESRKLRRYENLRPEHVAAALKASTEYANAKPEERAGIREKITKDLSANVEKYGEPTEEAYRATLGGDEAQGKTAFDASQKMMVRDTEADKVQAETMQHLLSLSNGALTVFGEVLLKVNTALATFLNELTANGTKDALAIREKRAKEDAEYALHGREPKDEPQSTPGGSTSAPTAPTTAPTAPSSTPQSTTAAPVSPTEGGAPVAPEPDEPDEPDNPYPEDERPSAKEPERSEDETRQQRFGDNTKIITKGSTKYYTRGKGKHAPNPETPTAAQFMQYIRSRGQTRNFSATLTAVAKRESGFDPRAVGDYSQKDQAYLAQGTFQWHPDRRKPIEDHYGKKIEDMTWQEQVDAKIWELGPDGPLASVGRDVRAASDISPREGARVDTIKDQRPANKDSEGRNRGNLAEKYAREVPEIAPVAPTETTTAPTAPTETTTTPVAPTETTTAPVAPTETTTAPVAPTETTTTPSETSPGASNPNINPAMMRPKIGPDKTDVQTDKRSNSFLPPGKQWGNAPQSDANTRNKWGEQAPTESNITIPDTNNPPVTITPNITVPGKEIKTDMPDQQGGGQPDMSSFVSFSSHMQTAGLAINTFVKKLDAANSALRPPSTAADTNAQILKAFL